MSTPSVKSPPSEEYFDNMLLKIKLKLYYTAQGKKHILIKKEKCWEVVSKHSSVA